MTRQHGLRRQGLIRQTTGLLILAVAALIYLLLRYGFAAPWSWR